MTTETLPTPTAPPPVSVPPLPNVPTPTPTIKQVSGMKIMVENPKGSTRTGTGRDGKEWKVNMLADYGFLPSGKGEDGEGLDAYVGDDTDAKEVHIIHQNGADGRYDEDKAHLNFPNADAAKASYMAHMPPDRYRSHTSMPVETFKSMLTNAEPGSAHWKKKHGRAHGTTATLSNATNGELTKLLETLSASPYAADGLKNLIEMAKAKLARCPGCKSHDVTRMPGQTPDEGPMDKCRHCGKTFSPKPFTITPEQHNMNMARQDGRGANPVDPDAIGTTNTAGWQEGMDPPVQNADGTTVGDDDNDEKADGGQDDADQIIANLGVRSSLARRLLKRK